MFRFLKISGNSLDPAYRDGDFVLVCMLPAYLRTIRPGDAVVFQHAAFGTLVKLVAQVAEDRATFQVVGLRDGSVDSRQFGPVHRSRITGKVLWRIPKA